jgi:hypothetical protein
VIIVRPFPYSAHARRGANRHLSRWISFVRIIRFGVVPGSDTVPAMIQKQLYG